MKIKSMSKLLAAAGTIRRVAEPIMRNQIRNTQDRLNQGVDVSGDNFTPYLDQGRFRGREPLSRAASLFDEARVDVSTSSQGGVEIRATITGEAAKIAHYQNIKRRFLGYSAEDRREAMLSIRRALREGFKNGGY